jgi:hypothetical protein
MALPTAEDLLQIYQNNPADSIQPTDLIYLIRYPYNQNNDMAAPASAFSRSLLMQWYNIDNAYAALQVNSGYVINRPSLVMLSLPTESNFGDQITILNIGSGGFQLAQNNGQNIQLGIRVTTTGSGGYVASTAIGDSIGLICVIPNSMWFVNYIIGNITFV